MVTQDTAAPLAQALPPAASVVVVGAGYAGLSAALSLQDQGIDVLVLEGSDRVGGRVLSEELDGGLIIDHGGQWVGPTQRHLIAAAARFGCPTFPTYDTGDYLELWQDGVCRPFRGSGPVDGFGVTAYEDAIEQIDTLARTIDLDSPTATKHLEDWDSQTVHSFFASITADDDVRTRLALSVQGVWTVEPRDISLFHFLFYVASAGGYEQLMETAGCAQDRRFVRGAQSVALAIAEHLGDRVHVNAPVRQVDQTGAGVQIRTDRGTVSAHRVVVAAAPGAAVRISFNPPLPASRNRWMTRNPMGDVAKVHAVYDTPFWRDQGLSGQGTVYGDPSVGVVFDNSPAGAECGVLVAFVYADRLRHWAARPADERRAEVLSTLQKLFGPRAGDPDQYTEKIWTEDPWAFGGYAANPAPGVWFEHGATGWRNPCGRIHWAGTETASVWNGYIDGAISSGQRAADEIATALRGH
ncbi:FAD-dependent oxidoreductase [Mycobacterium sp. 21AC1]|uniref:flavin monoamine oxidase family protein n=1 Tax=[Mycobacterium] appelbergii TaxID=2939269 RepID=UPI0029393D07|nr:FAD-dependent oxidoreductase [Mycobacterium sp. 21AC1]MDV3125834.1 FAD-dependent oxidoreductase [Mycobacterium sp. 21AC1]